ncbi:MAG TPA: M28 family peptidase [Flavobacteriales bacterium]|nr:M28 family peptidase [Flavobacteriales bacterium]
MGNRVFILGVCLITLLFLGKTKAQNQAYARSIIDTLSSASFHGRGYVMQGDSLAAEFIGNEFEKIGLHAYKPGYYQVFKHDVNTFPGAMEVSLDDLNLKPGADYIVSPYSKGTYGTFQLHWLNDLVKLKPNKLRKFLDKTGNFNFIVIEEGAQKPDEMRELMIAAKKTFGAKGIVLAKKKLTWAVSSHVADLLVVEILQSRISVKASTINLNIENKLQEDYQSRNVIAYKDNGHPDSVIVFTAHYDHLGRMGRTTYFPGANDNASGVSMLFDLAQHYQADSNKYNVAFIAFAGEEAGLVGSKYYTENPLFPLKNIKFLINIDLMGNGEEGITVVNGTIHETEFELITALNEFNEFVPMVKKRGKAQNSDHYFFTESDVPAFFIYTLGGNKAYHDIFDVSETLEMQKYNEVFQLITSFIKAL